ncbi:high frequency lysogenization protein HflD [Billgrantia desiderata]|uniref:High frequency lysogenization protein HflD homolog n=1 Tax=Billgrantia desiderata TaxID=52021 RepID=A0AAW4YVD4_9GAMM|nr:high frequency lysogenization protein HflD [Halomonas desiderata]MCE8028053.1 high frequency lysogenization protein HflD [Halomonas desiderata]MCE8043239.1 high frequency lysogenization protein HflD [Halomonas desiderata]MCE8047664.1 high frequency lysogenization protein HflD [Halomonas desiderata]MCE8052369.1 high frequency lysogenization protein HflD [Halomonas desiderata]OUE39811.1 lysogenization regulator HflD [Halomonas desiderata SP1]
MNTTPIHRAPDTPAARQALALAGVFQAASLVDELARTGQVEPRPWETLIRATLDTDPESFEAIYGGHPNNLRRGLEVLEAVVGRRQANPVVLRYGFSLLLLMSKLRNDNAMMSTLGQHLSRIQGQAEHFGATHENVIASLGEAYQETLSTLKTRIVVQGDPSILQSRMMPERVRAILLAGIRFALLWHQQGGRRWRLVLQRGALKNALDQLG